MVVFGRPKGHRGSYLQWLEDDIAPQVVFEVLSPGNRHGEMVRKFQFYNQYSVEEYYVLDPDNITLDGWIRTQENLTPIEEMNGWSSPRLNICFRISESDILITKPDGTRFLTYLELYSENEQARQRLEAEQKRADAEQKRADAERTRAERMAARLRELGEDTD